MERLKPARSEEAARYSCSDEIVPSTGDMCELIREKVINKIHTVVTSTQHAERLKALGSKAVAGVQVPKRRRQACKSCARSPGRTTKFIIKNGQPALTTYDDHARLYIQQLGDFCIDDTYHRAAELGHCGSAAFPDVHQQLFHERSWQHRCIRHDGRGIVQQCQEPGVDEIDKHSAASKRLVSMMR